MILLVGVLIRNTDRSERDDSMEKIISKLVEFDHVGQKIVHEAEEQKRYTLSHMGDFKKQMSDQYRQRSDHRIEFFRQQAQSDTEEQREQLRREYDARMEKLRLHFQEKGDNWVHEVVDRCIGG